MARPFALVRAFALHQVVEEDVVQLLDTPFLTLLWGDSEIHPLVLRYPFGQLRRKPPNNGVRRPIRVLDPLHRGGLVLIVQHSVPINQLTLCQKPGWLQKVDVQHLLATCPCTARLPAPQRRHCQTQDIYRIRYRMRYRTCRLR